MTTAAAKSASCIRLVLIRSRKTPPERSVTAPISLTSTGLNAIGGVCTDMKITTKTSAKVKKSVPQARKEQKAKKRVATKPAVAKKTGGQDAPIGGNAQKTGKPETAGKDEFGLSIKEREFADRYILCKNGSQAYRETGYTCRTDNVASVGASQLLAKPKMKAYIKARLEKIHTGMEVTQERVIQEVARLAFLDPRKLFRENGSLIPIHELDEDTARGLQGFDVVEMAGAMAVDGEGGVQHSAMFTKKVKWDKQAGLDKLMRFLALYKDTIKHSNDPANPLPASTVIIIPAKNPA